MQHNTTGHIPDADTLLGGESLGLPLVIGMLLDCVLTLILIVFMCVFLFLYPSAAATATFPDERPLGPSQVKYRTCTDSKDYQQVSCFNHLSLHARQGYCYFSFISVHLLTQLFLRFPFQQKKKSNYHFVLLSFLILRVFPGPDAIFFFFCLKLSVDMYENKRGGQ